MKAKNRVLTITGILFLFFATNSSHAGKIEAGAETALPENTEITFSTEEWLDATNKDGTGLYWDILRAVYESEGFSVKHKIRTYADSVNELKNKAVDAVVGAYIYEIDSVIYPQNHFGVDIVQVIFLKNKNIQWTTIDTLRHQRVGWIQGYSYHDYLPGRITKTLKISRLDNRQQAFDLLRADKLDFYIDAKSDLSDFLDTNPVFVPTRYFREDILELKLYVAFSNNEKGREYADIFDRRFPELLRNGAIKALYDKYKANNFTYPKRF
ncbi:MAG: transporter substrate-binding domain-containing protein [Pseudomonadales bacterium]|nr:transporter substrate-binding domain-containing protein [Pseudomonadales bacterium]